MPRQARVVIPGLPHHVTQRGNRRQRTFFAAADYCAYIDFVSHAREVAEADILAYCLMPNHVHLIVVPEHKDSLASLFRLAHGKYTRRINKMNDWQGHLWQERFFSCVMDEPHLMACGRYVELNPVRAGLCQAAQQWPWSSARPHLAGVDDQLVSVEQMLQRVGDWQNYLRERNDPEVVERLRSHLRSGMPAGDKEFIERLETLTGRSLSLQSPGRKPRDR